MYRKTRSALVGLVGAESNFNAVKIRSDDPQYGTLPYGGVC